jgi:hypothetical protein
MSLCSFQRRARRDATSCRWRRPCATVATVTLNSSFSRRSFSAPFRSINRGGSNELIVDPKTTICLHRVDMLLFYAPAIPDNRSRRAACRRLDRSIGRSLFHLHLVSRRTPIDDVAGVCRRRHRFLCVFGNDDCRLSIAPSLAICCVWRRRCRRRRRCRVSAARHADARRADRVGSDVCLLSSRSMWSRCVRRLVRRLAALRCS